MKNVESARELKKYINLALLWYFYNTRVFVTGFKGFCLITLKDILNAISIKPSRNEGY